MTQLKIVNYRSAKAYYKVKIESDKSIVATLEKYLGDKNEMPPRSITYIKNLSYTVQNEFNGNSLLADISRATDNK